MEKQRWGEHACCPHCGDMDVYKMTDSKTGERQANFRWRCRGCKKQFTVRIGTVFEDSRIPLKYWCYGFWRASTSKKGVSALEIHRQTGLSYKSSLFLLHRIRFAMSDSVSSPLKGDVEVDETYVGGKPRYKGQSKRGRGTNKQPVLALVERNGNVKTKVIADVTAKTLQSAIKDHVHKSSRIITDDNPSYNGIGKNFDKGHESVCHSSKEFVRGDVYSNTVEGFFSIVKRGLNGIYHAVSKKHLHRYLSEFEFRYNYRELDDGQRTAKAIKSSQGKRLIYSAISKHLKNIFETNELEENRVVSILETTAPDGKIYKTNHYNLDAIISLGYRINSKKATAFRKWATNVLSQYIKDGFVIDEIRLKEEPDKLNKLAAKIRELRASEKNVYASVRECFRIAASDYEPSSQTVKTKTTPAKGYDIILFEKFMDKHDMTDAMTYAPREVPKNVVPLHELDKLIFNQRK